MIQKIMKKIINELKSIAQIIMVFVILINMVLNKEPHQDVKKIKGGLIV